jgi:glycine cleavage system H protein
MKKYYTKEHEWIALEGKSGTVGISDYAQEQLGDVVYVELPEAGRALTKGEEAAVVESVKAASEIYAPLSGTITASNDALSDDPSLINSDPELEGWFFKMDISDELELDDMMSEAAYKTYLQSLS